MATTKKSVIAGYNVYLNEHKQKILLDPLTKVGYLVREDDYQRFNLYHNRWALAIAIGAIAYSITTKVSIGLLIGIAFGLFQEFRYRHSWLPSMTQYPNFKPKNKVTFIQGLLEQNKVWDCLLLGILYIAFGVLLVVNGYMIKSSTVILVLEYVIMAWTIFRGIQYFIAFANMIKKK